MDIKSEFLTGKNIYLRPLLLADLEGDYINWINDGEMIKNLATLYPQTPEQLEEYVKSILANRSFVFFAIVDRESQKHIGNAKIGPIDWINRTTNYGRIISKEYWGKGYGTQVLKLIQKYVFEKLNLNKIWDMAVIENDASLASNRKSGMKQEAILREHVFKNGQYRDVVVLSQTQKEYFKHSDDK